MAGYLPHLAGNSQVTNTAIHSLTFVFLGTATLGSTCKNDKTGVYFQNFQWNVISTSLLKNFFDEMKMRWMYNVTGVILQLASGTKNLGPPIKDVNLVTGYQEMDKPSKHQLNYI